jgi:hypothetical protein
MSAPARTDHILGVPLRIIEVAEYASLRDDDHRSVGALVDLLVGSLTS